MQARRTLLAWLLACWEVIPVLALALGLVLAYVRSVSIRGLPFDDSYISLQFARNLARHGFLTFDGETASAGATSILHVALLAVPIKLGVSPVHASMGLGILLQLGLVLAVYWLGRAIFHDRLAALFAAASVAVMGYAAFDALNGMETTLFMLLVAAATAAFLQAESDRGFLGAGLLAALALLTRPEGALLLAAMTLYHLLDARRGRPLRSPANARRLALLLGPTAAAVAGLAAFYLWTTGSPTPGAATAKFRFFQEYNLPWPRRGDLLETGIGDFLKPVLPWIVLAALSIRRREALLFGFFAAGFLAVYFMLFPGGTVHYWYRYDHAFLPFIAVFAAGGLAWAIRRVNWRSGDVIAAVVIGLVLLGGIIYQYNAFRNHYSVEVTLNETRQVGMALYLRDNVPPDQTIATHDIGVIGFYSQHKVIDLVGLVNPDVISYHSGRRVRQYVDSVRPDYIVVFPSWEQNFLHIGLQDNPQLFEQVRSFGWWGVEPFVVYKTHYQ